jgi:hypothetical protein
LPSEETERKVEPYYSVVYLEGPGWAAPKYPKEEGAPEPNVRPGEV